MPSATLPRIDLAIEQLDVAIELFLSERSNAAALTLAGAAEEILGKAVSQAGGESAIGTLHRTLAAGHRVFPGGDLSQKQVADRANYARNAAKHMDLQQDSTLDADLRREAQAMIVRACANYSGAGRPWTDAIWRFNDWYIENEVGV